MPTANPPPFRYAWIAAAGAALVCIALLAGLLNGERLTPAVLPAVIAGFVAVLAAGIAVFLDYWRATRTIPFQEWRNEPYRSIWKRSRIAWLAATICYAGGCACSFLTLAGIAPHPLGATAIVLISGGVTAQLFALSTIVVALEAGNR